MPRSSMVAREAAWRRSSPGSRRQSSVRTHSAISSTVGTAVEAASTSRSSVARSPASSARRRSVPGGTTPASTARRMLRSEREISVRRRRARRTAGESPSLSMARTAARATRSESSGSEKVRARAVTAACSTSSLG
uniref:hypothetical protein n=1 Tax=Olsenella timonensis TaxID=1805478 RepID=UPI0011CB3755|nr:hypothetical protein [Olsenella timonensis]